MIANYPQTTKSIKREASEFMGNMEFPNNISPRKKPWFAQNTQLYKKQSGLYIGIISQNHIEYILRERLNHLTSTY